jgi:UDP-2,3-diacylglucosamine hydrolase
MQINSAIFVSDFHLDKSDKKRYYKVHNFLKSLIGKHDHIFFLGDIFEFWHNDRKALLNEYKEIIDVFLELSRKGTKLHFFEGNHDICYGNFFKNSLNAQVYRNCVTLQINNLKVFLGHGDELGANNLRYYFFRSLLRLKTTKLIISSAPSYLVLKTALLLSKASRNFFRSSDRKKANLKFIDIATQKINEGVDVVILGHSHIPESVKISKGHYFNCGNWLKDASFIEFKEGFFKLKNHS